ncbi:hypothetical protein ACOI1H_07280 [Loktanella sp. DJP18]|uniref:hypothetical protein n=1 Tax=Loktanella sp. DJP18 TaxID=3409788 RepID=UPI003BB4FFD8
MSNVVADGNKDFICLATGKGYGVHFLGVETIKSPTDRPQRGRNALEHQYPRHCGEPNGAAALDDRNRYPRHAHQGYRGGGVRFCEFDGCAISQTHGWTGGSFSDNACMRVDTAASKDQNIYISRCNILGSVNYADASGTTAVKSPSTNALFQMCVFSQNPTLGNMIYLEGSGFTLRSCMFLAPPTTSGGDLREFINLTDGAGWDAYSNLYPNVLNGNTEVITVKGAQIGFYTPMDDPAKHPL